MASRIPANHWLRNIKIAHRGLHDETIPENSLLSYQKAAELGLAIEIDVYLTLDDQIVVFHDSTLNRMTGVDKKITQCTLAELKQLRLNNTDQTIPTLQEVLDVCEGKSPLLIEIKGESTKVGKLEQIMYDMLKNYKGDFAIQSFNPFSVKWYADNAPEIIRGVLSSYFMGEKIKWYKKLLVKRLLMNGSINPDFVSYDQVNMPNNICKKERNKGRLIINWTVTSKEREEELREYYDNIIFENYMPDSIFIK